MLISWQPPIENGGNNITKYNIYKSNQSGNQEFLNSVDFPETYFNDTSVENGKMYYYYITAMNSIGESSKSKEVKDGCYKSWKCY